MGIHVTGLLGLLIFVLVPARAFAASDATTFPVGQDPSAIAAGDFNGDGHRDLVTANYVDNDVSVLLGNGSGGFASAHDFHSGGEPHSVAVGDFNGDGKQDLAVANSGGNSVTILRGDGNGGFHNPRTYLIGRTPLAVVTGTFGGAGGSLDLAVANGASANIAVFSNDGSGVFEAPTTYHTGVNPSALAVGDLNGDGNPDLAVTNGTPQTVSILLGDGSGGFADPVNLPVPDIPVSVAIADFNGDGKPDLAVGLERGGAETPLDYVLVLLGNGDGSFTAGDTASVGHLPYSEAVGDFDGDGNLDLAVSNYLDDTVSLLRGNGDGGFRPQTVYPVGSAPTAVVAKDFDEDGRLDLAASNGGDADVSLLLNRTSVPPKARISGAPNPALSGDSVELDASKSTPPPLGEVTDYKWDLDGDGTFETDTGATPTVSTSYSEPGTYSPSVRVVSSFGTTDIASTSLDVRRAPRPGELGVTINHGDTYTNDTNVTLSAIWPAYASSMVASNDGGFLDPGTFPVDYNVPWKLASSGPERLPKTVYVRFKGGESGPETYTDDIILDERAPVVEQARIRGGHSKLAGSRARKTTYRLRIKARDKLSGVRKMQITSNKRHPRSWKRFDSRAKLRTARHKVFVRVRDGAKNKSHWQRAR